MNEKLERKRTQSIVMTALMTALVMSVTLVTKIELPVGYFNLGDLVVIIIACIMPLRISIFAAGVGSALTKRYKADGADSCREEAQKFADKLAEIQGGK